jgi:putative ABC transport system permease protein
VLVVALLAVAVPLLDLLRRPTFRNLALRNVSRRKGEAALVVLGSLLGTAIITASFVVGDTIDASIRDGARTRLGPIDEAVRLEDRLGLDELERLLADPPIADTDGWLPVVSAGGVAASIGDGRRAQPSSGLLELDLDRARVFGGDPAATGLAAAGPNLAPGEAVIGERLAGDLGLAAGDRLEVFLLGTSRPFIVRTVVPDVGLVGYLPVRQAGVGGGEPAPVIVAPGTIADILDGSPSLGSAPPIAEVVVSNSGGVFDSADQTAPVKRQLERRVGERAGVEVLTVKRTLLDQARAVGDTIGSLYRGVGFFSVIAGILLLVNLFVMLSEERKTELGMLRAVGFKRNHLVRTFAMEGALYSVVASVLGAVLGIGVGWVIAQISASVFSSGSSRFGAGVAIVPRSLLLGATIGLTISMLTVWGTSLRISRLNIIRAIRDLNEPAARRPRAWTLALAAIGVFLGALVLAGGVARPSSEATLVGPALALFCLVPILLRFLPRRPVVLVVSVLVLTWSIGAFTLAPDAMGRAGINTFIVQGILLVGSAVALLSSADRVWGRLAGRLSGTGVGLGARLGLAYPLARRFRTSMLLGMYAIVIFTMTFISVLATIASSQAPQFTDQLRAGFDLYVDSNPGNPLPPGVVTAQPEVTDVAVLPNGVAQFTTAAKPAPAFWALTGFDQSLLRHGVPELEARDPAYVEDRAAFEALLADPDKAIISSFFLQRGGPPQKNLEPGERITVINPLTGAQHTKTVIGRLAQDSVFNGVFVSAEAVDRVLGPRASPSRLYVKVAPGSDAGAVAARLQGERIENGVRSRTFRARVDETLTQNNAFFSLLRGYLGLGLLIGIAGLGVVMVRAVRERRRQIGMLRAMGFSSRLVRRAFVLEAGFVALQGILIGVVLGVVTSYQLLVNSEAFGSQRIDFVWPWPSLAAIVVVPLVASLLATAAPAAQAARIRPAAALRIAD